MPRKKSMQLATERFDSVADEVLEFAEQAKQHLQGKSSISWAHDYAIIRLYRGFEEGEGQEIAVVRGRKACPVAAMKQWLEAGSITDGPVFRRMRRGGVVLPDPLRPQGIAQVVKEYAARAGYDPADFSGHSLRSGFLTSAAARGVSVFKLIEVSRHKSVDTLRGYIRKAEIFDDHAAEGLL